MMVIITENIYKDILMIILAVVTVVYFYLKWVYNYWQRRGIESVPGSIPFGSASRIVRRKVHIGELFREVYEKYKAKSLRYVGFYFLTKPALVFLDITLIKTILTKDFQHFTDHGSYVNEKHEPLTAHLFALKGQKWRRLRSKLTSTFTSGKMKMMFHTLVNCSNGLKEVMGDTALRGEAADIKDIAARYTTDVIGSCAFGLDCNSLKSPDSDFRKVGIKIFQINIIEAFVRFLALVSPQIVSTLGLRFLNKSVSDFIMKIVRETVDYREKNNIKRDDFLHLLIQLKNNVQLNEDEDLQHYRSAEDSADTEGLTIEEISAQVFVFFVGGFETSSTTLAFCLFELAVNTDIQEKLRVEIQTILEEHDNSLTYDAIMKMSYLDKCIQETLRKYPPLPFLFRECTEEYKIAESNVNVEKGTRVFIPILGIHYDPEFYPDPDKFDPERFSVENKAKRDHFSWLPFGEGPRACIGLRFGLLQTKVALAVLLNDYEFALSNRTGVPLAMSTVGIMTTAKGGIWLNVKKCS